MSSRAPAEPSFSHDDPDRPAHRSPTAGAPFIATQLPARRGPTVGDDDDQLLGIARHVIALRTGDACATDQRRHEPARLHAARVLRTPRHLIVRSVADVAAYTLASGWATSSSPRSSRI